MPTDRRRLKGSTDASNAASYSPSAAPSAPWANGDTLTFDEGANTNFDVGMTAAAGISSLATVRVTSGCKDNIGKANDPFKVDVSGTLIYEGGGDYSHWAGGTGGTIAAIICNPSNPNHQMNLSSGTFPSIKVLAGTVIIGGSAVLADIEVIGAATIVVPEDATDVLNNIRVAAGGRAIVKRRINGTGNVDQGGTLENNVDSTTASGTINLNGGTLVHLKGSLVVNGYSGVYDWHRLEKGGAYTLTLTEYEALTEKTGPVLPSGTITRTLVGKGSRKV